MKKEFSNKWKASRQTRKQRKYLANAPSFLKHRIMSSAFSKDLRKKYGRRSFPLRKGDKVKIMRGEFKNKIGKVDSIEMKKMGVTIEGMQITKKEGTKVRILFKPSKLQIQELYLEDKKRIEAIERRNKNKPEKK